MQKGLFTIMVYHNATLPASPSSMVAVTTPRVLMWLSIAASKVIRFTSAKVQLISTTRQYSTDNFIKYRTNFTISHSSFNILRATNCP